MERAIGVKQSGAASWLGPSRASHLNFSATSPAAVIYAGFFAYTMHQPCAAIVPSTVLQEEGGSNSAQLSQRCSPFGVSRYFTAFCGAFAACAAVDVPMIAAVPAIDAPVAMVKTAAEKFPLVPS